jgi:hypothetical protein
MSIRRRLTALEQHAGAAGSRTGPDRLSREEVAVVVDLATRGDATPVAALPPLALEALPKARRFAAFLNQMAKSKWRTHE